MLEISSLTEYSDSMYHCTAHNNIISTGSALLSIYYDHLSPDYQCPMLPECEYRGQEIVRRHRLGGDQEHQCWDKREDIRDDVEEIVSDVVGQDMADDRVFINRLLQGVSKKMRRSFC